MEPSEAGVQINKFVSNSGYCSRREADKLIEQERVNINNVVALLTDRVKPGDKVAVDGEFIKTVTKDHVYLAFNKPIGVTSTTDSSDKRNIIHYIKYPKRIFPIGRLDKESEGLILLTDDGDIVNKILRAGNQHEKEYIVTVDKAITPDFIDKMGGGVPILDTVTQLCKVRQLGSKKFNVVLTQGLNRQIRHMCDYLNYKVVALKRVRIMHILLDDIPVGKWRKLLPHEIKELNEKLLTSTKTEDGSIRKASFRKKAVHSLKPKSEVRQADSTGKPKFKSKSDQVNKSSAPKSKFKPKSSSSEKGPSSKHSTSRKPEKSGSKPSKGPSSPRNAKSTSGPNSKTRNRPPNKERTR